MYLYCNKIFRPDFLIYFVFLFPSGNYEKPLNIILANLLKKNTEKECQYCLFLSIGKTAMQCQIIVSFIQTDI